ncbi:tape measure protein [uncultured Dubosiella sp.]|uniref:tape measure protein n=1 Tax=uncultured Dubosiella sp. TaxID=1937011 RepID=UPI002629C38E|nr:tape measure protein [uncultured Dubosiella sp.]
MIDEIAVEVKLNNEDAKKKIKELDKIMKELDKRKIKIQAQIDKLPQIQAQLNKLKQERDELNNKKIKIEADAPNLQTLTSNLDQVKSRIQALQNEKIRIQTEMQVKDDLNRQKLQIDKQIQAIKEARTQIRDTLDKGLISGDSDIEEARNQIKSLTLDIEKLTNQKNQISLHIKDINQLQSRVKEIDAELKKLNDQKAEIQVKIREGEKAQKELDSIEKKAEKLDEKAIEIQAKIEGAESAKKQLNDIEKESNDLKNEKVLVQTKIQDYDRTMSQLNNLRSVIGTIGKDMANFGKGMRTFIGNNGNNPIGKFANFLTQGVAYGSMYRLTSNAMNAVSESFTAGINRFDTINAGTRTLKALGFEGSQVDSELKNLQDNILGLPTTLDQAIGEVTKISAVTNDLPYAVRAYDALNNSILSFGGSAEQSQRAINQVSQSLGKGVIDAQTYNSLINNNMTPALKKVAEMFGYSGEELGKFKEDLGSGAISANQFLDSLIKLNEEGYDGMESLQSIAKGNALLSISAGMDVARARMAAGWQSTITDINDSMKELGYGTIPEMLSNLGDFGKEKIAGIGTWFKENKEQVGDALDWIGDKFDAFFKELEGFNPKSFLSGIIDVSNGINAVVIPMIKGLYDATKKLATFVGGGDMSKGYGRLLAGYLGTSYGLQFIGNVAKGAFGLFDKMSQYKNGFGKNGLLGYLGSLIGFSGHGKSNIPSNAGQSLTNAGKAVGGLQALGNSLGNFDVGGFLNKASNLALLAGVAGDIIVFSEAVKKVDEAMPEDSKEWENITLKLLGLSGIMTGFTVFAGVVGAMSNIDGVSGAIKKGAVDLALVSADVMIMAEAMKQMDEKVPDNLEGLGEKLGYMAITIGSFSAVAGALGAFTGAAAAILIGGVALDGIVGELVLFTEGFSAVAYNLQKIDSYEKIDAASFTEKIEAVKTCLDAIGSDFGEIIGRGMGSAFDASYYNDLKNSTESIYKIMRSFDNIQNVNFNGDNVVSKVTSVKSVMEEIKGLSMPTLQITPQTAENLATTLENLSKMAKEAQKLNDVDLNFDSAKISNAVTRLKIVAEAFKDVTFPEGKANFQAEDAENMLRTFQSLSQVVEPMNKFNDSMKDFKGDVTYQKVQQLGTLLGRINADYIAYDFKSFPKNEDVSNVLEGIKTFSQIATAISEFSSASESYNTIQGDVLMGKIVNFFETFNDYDLEGMINTFNKQSKNFSSVKTGLENFGAMVDALTALNGKTIDTENLTAIVKSMNEFFKALNGDDGKSFSLNDGVIEQLNTAKTAMNSLKKLVTYIQTVSQNTINWESLGTGDGGLINQVNLFLQDVASLNAGDAQTAISNVQSVLDQLNQMLITMQGMSDQFTETGANWGLSLWEGFESADVKGQMLSYVDSIIRLMESKAARFRTVGSIWGKALDAGFRDAVSDTGANAAANVVSGLEAASGSITSAGASLGGAFASAFNSAAANLNTPNVPGTQTAQGPNKDGSAGYTVKEHKAKGGPIFKPSGTDTVPAMLTPGEFVVSKRAVDHTGINLLDRINKMDLKGAYHALQARFGESQITNNQYITNNYTTNNDNRKVEINESHSRRSQYIRANRFLRGMA